MIFPQKTWVVMLINLSLRGGRVRQLPMQTMVHMGGGGSGGGKLRDACQTPRLRPPKIPRH